MAPDLDPSALLILWTGRWPSCRPIAHELRGCAPERWVRFHSLPHSKRYAENDAEYGELLGRHDTVIGELVGGSIGRHLLVVTCSWSGTSEPAPRDDALEAAFPSTRYWHSILREADDDWEYWVHLFVGRVDWKPGALDALLTLVADDRTADVIVAPDDFEWLYHPYDGGADVIAPDPTTRDALRDRHSEWLSPYPHGL